MTMGDRRSGAQAPQAESRTFGCALRLAQPETYGHSFSHISEKEEEIVPGPHYSVRVKRKCGPGTISSFSLMVRRPSLWA